MENTIEEEIEILEELRTHGYAMLLMKYEDRIKTNRKIDQALEHIVSDYKRVLKENEILKEEKEQAWEEWNNLEQGSYETEQKLKQQIKELRKENEGLNNRCRNLDTEAQAYLEELAGDNTLTKRTIKQLQEENEELKNKYATFIKMSSEVIANSILKSKLKEFFSSRLEKYQEADDGKYEQDYLTRGELELVDRYKECKEIAKIILEEEINSEVPQNCIPTSLVKEKIEKLDNVDNAEALEDLMNRQNYTITELVQFVLREILKEKNSD